jgi:3'-phosphoadenosine 5'-phosphosulfate (PAPS) 3'-phosphatase
MSLGGGIAGGGAGTGAADASLARETSVALAAAREAGALALSLQGLVEREDKADGSPVTQADLAADQVLRAHLALNFPEDALLSEEGAQDQDPPARLASRRVWIIDPIDGTSAYLGGSAEWAVQIALAIDGRLRLGVVAIPGEGIELVGIVGVGGSVISAAGTRELAAVAGRADVLIGSESKRGRAALARVAAALPGFAVIHAHSVGVKAWRLLSGQADLYVQPAPIAEWDAAAPAAVLLAGGGHASDLAGGDLRFNREPARIAGLVFSTRPDHRQLLGRLHQAGVGRP